MQEFKMFLPFDLQKAEKKDDGTVIVEGYASTPAEDSDGEVVTLKAVKAALPGYMAWANIREMHRLSAVGTARSANVDDTGLFLRARIVDKEAVKKVLEGVYKGFSIGGRKLAKVGNEITEIDMTEVSIVDRPANSECGISIAKAAKSLATTPDAKGYLVKVKAEVDPVKRALTKAVRALAKAVDNPPAAHDGFSLPAKPAAVEKRDVSTPERKELAGEGNANPDGSFPIKTKEDLKNAIKLRGHGDKARNKKLIMRRAKELDAEDMLPTKWQQKAAKKATKKAAQATDLHKTQKIAAMELGSAEPSPLALSVERGDDHIAKGVGSLGHDKPSGGLLPPQGGGPNLELKKVDRKKIIDQLEKSMSTASTLSCVFDSIRSAQRCLLMEGKREGDDSKDKQLAKRLGQVAKELAAIIGQKAEHEGEEALTLTDADDTYLTSTLGEDFTMAQEPDDLTKAILAAVSNGTDLGKARQPSKGQRLQMARDNMKKAKTARKEASGFVKAAFELHKAAYLAKASKAAKKPDDDDGFDHQGAMEKLQKAYTALENVATFEKAASTQLKKAVGSPGSEVGDGNGNYTVPPGVKDLTLTDLATAGPGGTERGGAPPMYPGDGSVYAGKAEHTFDLRKFARADGSIPLEMVQAATEMSRMEGELAAFRAMPAANGRRPVNFDLAKTFGGQGRGTAANDIQADREALFKGVDVAALQSLDENSRTVASARVVGNFLTNGRFGKSILEPNFHGAAGGRE